jgi:PBSX family phage terminase large subunit
MIKLALSTPNGTSLIGAATLPQLDQTAKKDFLSMLHPSFIEDTSVQKNYVDLVNGHRILFRPLDDPGKARSLNLCYIWIEEGSEVSFDYVVQLQTRMRNHATTKHQMIISSNPDLGWVRNEFLLKADSITGSERPYFVPPDDKNPNISVHIASTRLNKYLPVDYFHSVARGKENWWIERYLNASFDYAEGSVYQTFGDHIVQPFKIPQHWERIGGSDWGIRDYTVLLMAAIDPDTGIVYIYDEYYKNNLPIPKHAEAMKEMVQKVPYGKLRALVGDPAGKRRGNNDLRSIFDHYAEYGLWFKDGNNRIDAGIAKVNAYLSLGRLKIFSNCANLIREGLNYKYKPLELDSKKNMDEKPIDKDNHACFVAGTLIETINGLVTIEDIKIGDYVWTRQGYKRVYDSCLTGKNRQVFEVQFSNGTSIIATGNHPVFVENKGFLAIDSLRYSDIIKVSEHWEELQCTRQNSTLLSGTEKSGEDTLNPSTQATEGIIRKQTNGCTEKYGNSTTVKFQKGIMYTTKTMTQPIILLKTLNWLNLRNTWNTMLNYKILTKTLLNSEKRGLKRLKKKRLIGTSQKKGWNGIDNMLSILLLNSLKKLKPKSVSNAFLNLKPSILNPSFAQTTVSPLGEENKVWIMNNEPASPAGTNLPSTSTTQKNIVQVIAVTKLEEKHDVYNISVEDAHEYYANGVLVHNCDAMRYLINELPDDVDLLKQKSYASREWAGKTEDGHIPFALQTDEYKSPGKNAWLYY